MIYMESNVPIHKKKTCLTCRYLNYLGVMLVIQIRLNYLPIYCYILVYTVIIAANTR